MALLPDGLEANGGEEGRWIDRHAVFADFVMQVRSGGFTRGAHFRDFVSAFYPHA